MTDGPRAYRVLKSGARVVCRFYIAPASGGRWRIIDSDTWDVASGTEKTGYRREEAIEIAREYRDTYGAYVRSPF